MLPKIKDEDKIIFIPRAQIRPFPNQPRKHFDEEELQNLADSIKAWGQFIPIIVKKNDHKSKHKYELVDGQRRWHACGMVGVSEIKAIVVEAETEAQQFLMAVIANNGQEKLAPIEYAHSIKYFLDQGFKVEDIGPIFSHATRWVKKHLKLFKLDDRVLAKMSPEIPERQRLSIDAASRIAELPIDMQDRVANQVLTQGMKDYEANNFVRNLGNKKGVQVDLFIRKPYKDFLALSGFTNRIKREAAIFLGKSIPDYQRIFQSKDMEDLNKIIEKIDQNITDLEVMRYALRKVRILKEFKEKNGH